MTADRQIEAKLSPTEENKENIQGGLGLESILHIVAFLIGGVIFFNERSCF